MFGYYAIVLLAVYLVDGQVIFLGNCPDVTPLQDFEASKYLGKWYEAERYFAIFEFGGDCVTATYSANDNGTVKVENSQISSITGTKSSIIGEATLSGAANEAKLSVVFPSLPVQFAAPYWVLDTDYDNYSVVWSCLDFGLFNARSAWILTRAQVPTSTIFEEAYAVLDKFNVTRSYFTKTKQENCEN